jgi:hypothetical protein
MASVSGSRWSGVAEPEPSLVLVSRPRTSQESVEPVQVRLILLVRGDRFQHLEQLGIGLGRLEPWDADDPSRQHDLDTAFHQLAIHDLVAVEQIRLQQPPRNPGIFGGSPTLDQEGPFRRNSSAYR